MGWELWKTNSKRAILLISYRKMYLLNLWTQWKTWVKLEINLSVIAWNDCSNWCKAFGVRQANQMNEFRYFLKW